MNKAFLVFFCLLVFSFALAAEDVKLELIEFNKEHLKVKVTSDSKDIENYVATLTWNSGDTMILYNQGFASSVNIEQTQTWPILPLEGKKEIKFIPDECIIVVYKRNKLDWKKRTFYKVYKFSKSK